MSGFGRGAEGAAVGRKIYHRDSRLPVAQPSKRCRSPTPRDADS